MKNIGKVAILSALALGADSFAPSSKRHIRSAQQLMTTTTARRASAKGGSVEPPPPPSMFDGKTRQLLGIKGADSSSKEKWKIRLQLTKPLTWVPLSMIVMCGAAASGNYHWMWNPWIENSDWALGFQDAMMGLAAVILAGPFSEGFAQTINDWYDREIDAINEPYRPIPSGAITEKEVMEQLWFLFLGGLSLAVGLDTMVNSNSFPAITTITLLGYFMSYIYSAPPLKLKQNGLVGDLAIGLCYISMPWLCGQALFGSLDKPVDWLLPIFYSLTGIGAGIVNDFKSMEGDRKFGLRSIPILLGVDKAKWLAAVLPDVVQLGVAGYLNYSIGETTSAAILLGLLLPQIYFQSTLLLKDPFENDVKYMALSQPFAMLGVLTTAITMGQHVW